MPKISIIVPVYNAEKYLHRCIDCILAQIFTDFELLLINDGSKDRSGAICDEYAVKDSRVRVLHKENGGVSSARNIGLDNAKGEWIAFCDADDYVETTWLNIYIQNYDNVDCVIQGYNNDIILKKSNFYYEGTCVDVIKELFNRNIVGYLHTKIFRYSFIEKNNIRFNETIRFKEDEDFVLNYFSVINNVRCVSKGGYNYIMPNLSLKYSEFDNFSVSLSLYKSILKIYGNKQNAVTDSYLLGLLNSFFYSFYNGTDCYNRTKAVKKILGKKILRVEKLSIISRIVLYILPSYLVSLIFMLKGNIVKRR